MAEHEPLPLLRDALDRCLDALCATAVRSDDRAGWLSWDLDVDGGPRRMLGGRASLYDGDAGMAWALATLANATEREDLADLATGAARNVGDAGHAGLLAGQAGLLAGQAGIALAQYRAGQPSQGLPVPTSFAGADLSNGLAGLLLAQVRMGRCGQATIDAVDLLQANAYKTPMGVCWPESEGPDGRPLCGLAHGNSGIALALAEAAAAYPPCAPQAVELAVEALRWESAWFDPLLGGWPDLRTEPPSYPALWCHGAAGIAVVRLRLLGLPASLGLPVNILRAEAEAAVVACGSDLTRVLGSGSIPPTGLTLCHGIGGALEALTLAHDLWKVVPHLAAAREFAAAAVAGLDEDPLAWPGGVRAAGSTGLFVGVAGVALILARLIDPGKISSPALLL
ncbi:lanthionine synthetase LanC family protein [Arthrobacter sp. LAPM80]|uniref:lanthionine synthetase LanC family protein n=1 Tax=Arthrobacter sp. LAPM80 TaxID=3141788 RepID=UPI00398B9B91